MPFYVLTGPARAVKRALLDRIRVALSDGDHPLLMIVPAQYTLQAEMDVIELSGAPGSFRLQVLSPSRLYTRVFEQAGWPGGARIDEQGRVMLVHATAKHLKKRLTWYKNAVGRRGFAEKLLSQLEGFKQARVDPARILEMAESEADETLRRKLCDLHLLYAGYEQALRGRYLDGEDEARAATSRMERAALIQGAEIFVYGFDTVSASLAETLLELSKTAKALTLALTLHQDRRDADLFVPVERALGRLSRMAQHRGIRIERAAVPAPPAFGAPDIRHLERELYCIPLNRYQRPSQAVQLSMLRNPQEEAEYAAALIRELVMTKGWRWRDVAVACQTLDETYTDALRRAFAQSDVPLFLPDARPANRHPLAICLLSALRLISRGWQTDDMVDYLRSGFAPIGDDEADLLVNHILRHGLRGGRLKAEFRNLAEDQQCLEQARAAAAAPLRALEEKTRGRRDTQLILAAVFAFLEEVDVCARLEAQQDMLIDLGQREWAMEGPQVWNRVLLALDQMYELLGGERLSLREVGELMERSLAVSEVKPLPQSGDAVLCGSLDHMKSRPVRALLVLGLSDTGAPGAGGLLSESELEQLGGQEWSGSLGAFDRLRMQRLSLKSALSFAEDYLLLSYPGSDDKGAALKPGSLVALVRRAFPGQPLRGAYGDEKAMLRIRLNAPEAARNRLAALLCESPDDPYLLAAREALGELGMLPPGAAPESARLPQALAQRLFGGIDKVSVSRLERYVRCPYQHFASYGLRPEEFHEFTLTPQDTGEFYHQAMEQFIRENGAQLSGLSEEQSMRRMDEVTDQLMQTLMTKSLGEGAIARAQAEELRSVARRAAATVVSQLMGSRFAPTAIEIDFGQGEPRITLGDRARLGGRIDRLDAWQAEDEKYLRVIDYKTGGKSLSLAEVYYGLQMQLMVYLAAALKQQGGKPAGAFFFNISDKPVDTDARDPERVEAERLKALKLRGLLLKDPGVQSAMAAHPEAVLPTRGDGVVDAEEFELLIDHSLKQAERAFRRLRSGVIEVKPRGVGESNVCAYCEYKALCGRDPGAKINKLPSLRSPEVMRRIRDEMQGD